jgi:gamma-glutamyl-gamma-aminobutyraldehyde dehydrogenase
MNDHSLAQWTQAAAQIKPDGLAVIDGDTTESASGMRFESINPATGRVIASVARCNAEDIDRAVRGAQKAFDGGAWSQCSPRERKAVMLRLSDLMMAAREEFALLDSLDMGKSVRDAYAIDAPGAAGVIRWYAEAADKVYDEVAPVGPGAHATITREPVGVVGAVVPWNFPLDMAAWKLGPALMAGNSVVLKPAEQSPLSALRLASLALEAGVPPGVLQVVPGFGEDAGQALGRHPGVAALSFTGSTEVGKYFQRYAGESNMKMVWLECGGKSANLVFADCDNLDLAAQKAAFGFCFNQGEVCSANTRLLVERRIYEAFVEKLVANLSAWQPGDPLDPASGTGALVTTEHTERVMRFIETGKREGGAILAGGEQRRFTGSSNYVTPTVFAGLSPDSTLAREEIFGPVAVVLPFDDEAQAIALANGSEYALAASVWTDNLKRAHRVSRALRAGTVSVNTVDALDPCVPFGGFGLSGYGRDLSLHAIDKFTQLKTTWTDLSA